MTTTAKSTGTRLAELRRSGAARVHQDRRTKRSRSRAEAKRQAIREQTETLRRH